jgi:hypothetical protein
MIIGEVANKLHRSMDSSVLTRWKGCGLNSLILHMKNMIASSFPCLSIRKSVGSHRLSRCMNGTSPILNDRYELLTRLASSTTSTNMTGSSGCHSKTWQESSSKVEFKE